MNHVDVARTRTTCSQSTWEQELRSTVDLLVVVEILFVQQLLRQATMLSKLCPESYNQRRPIFRKDRRGDTMSLRHRVNMTFGFRSNAGLLPFRDESRHLALVGLTAIDQIDTEVWSDYF